MNKQILCFYKNTTSKIQIARLSQQFEQVVFPGEKLLFEAIPEAELKIESEIITGKFAINKVPCFNLQVLE
jgi:Domain of unknown function (DUF1830)